MRDGFCVKDAATCEGTCQGHWCPNGFGAAAAAVPAVAPAAGQAAAPVPKPNVQPVVPAVMSALPAQTASAGKAACCSSAKDSSNACGTCWKGSDITSGWCVD